MRYNSPIEQFSKANYFWLIRNANRNEILRTTLNAEIKEIDHDSG